MAWVTKDSKEEYTPQTPARVYTKQEKTKNWWHYHRWAVLAGAAAAGLAAWFIHDVVTQVKPDYQVAWVGRAELPEDTASALTAALEAFGEDQNGDGKVVVVLNQFTVDFSEDTAADANTQMAGITKLSADLATGSGSYLYFVEDPEGFEKSTGALQYLDGTLPDTDAGVTDWQNLYYRWTDCPVLAGLPLGTFTGYTMADDVTGNSQDLFKDVYVGRRGVWDEGQKKNFAGGPELWAALTAGAAKLPGATR